MKELKVLELFGGIGACSKALERLGIDYEIADYVEIDKYAVKSFNAMHGTNFEPQDICKWDKDIDVDLIMHGSPCQDFSIAGLQAGGDKESGTRSSLMYETIRIVEKIKPKYVIWENVKNILSKKHKHNFDNYLETMENLGYTNYYQVLNAKDYGIPQNRERVFTISIRNDIEKEFIFPPKQELKLRLKDLLEDEVDEKFFINEEMASKIQLDLKNKNTLMIDLCQWRREGHPREYNDILPTLSFRDYKEPRCIQVGNLKGGKRLTETIEKNIDKFKEGKVLNMDLYNKTVNENLSQTITLPHHNTQRLFDGLRIRKLTPKECWRLMGFNDEDFEKAEKVNSNTQLYKQAGNSIVVNVLEAIFKELLNDYLQPTPTLEDLLKGL